MSFDDLLKQEMHNSKVSEPMDIVNAPIADNAKKPQQKPSNKKPDENSFW